MVQKPDVAVSFVTGVCLLPSQWYLTSWEGPYVKGLRESLAGALLLRFCTETQLRAELSSPPETEGAEEMQRRSLPFHLTV